MTIKLTKEHKCFGGQTQIFEHNSISTKTKMRYAVHLPCDVSKLDSCIIWLSGLTCNEENFITKSGIQSILQNTNTMIICPDTSPRGLNLPEEHTNYDFGSGAGFYINATTTEYNNHYNMYDYISQDLYSLIQQEYKINNISIMGHSMGGHGALILGLREPEKFKSISAFAPIVNPTISPWGQKALTGYLGSNTSVWADYDATLLVQKNNTHPNTILMDQGDQDEFLKKELLINNFIKACKETNQPLQCNIREGYDHSYYFISTFLKNHIEFHLKYLAVID